MKKHLLRSFALSSVTLSVLALCSNLVIADEPAKPVGSATSSGIDIQYIDPSVRVQDDFFSYLNGKWLKTTEIPADKSSWGAFAKLRDDTQPQLRDLIEAAQKDTHKKIGSEEQKMGDFYASYMDEKKLEALSYQPLAAELQHIRVIKNKKAIPALIAHLNQIGVAAPYSIYVGQDASASTKYAAHISQGGLGLPDRDYYLKKDDTKLADVRAKYERHIEKILSLAGEKNAAANAKAIIGLETALAEVQWTKVENRDPVKRYNRIEIKNLDTITPGYDWQMALGAAGIASKVDYVIVGQPSYFTGLNQLIQTTDLATWKSYFEWQLLRSYSEYLSKNFVDANFDFYGTTITGVTEMRPRWKRGVTVVESALGEAVGKKYVARYFPAERKIRMEELVKNLLVAYKQSIDTLDWMSPETKREAQAKLAKFTPKIAYPNKWRDYSALSIKNGDLVGNVMRANTFSYQRRVDKLGKPIDREEWGMTPQTVNAYYNSSMNEIVFPASILQPPFFDMGADDAVNYGAIGAVIGHEISHGFDDKGSLFDGDGNLRDWWTKEDRKNFSTKTDMLVAQYNSYSPLPGYNVNGELTLGENIADNSGIAIAFKAYKLSLNGKPAPVIDGLTGDQRFYMGFGQVWRSKMRDQQQIVQVKTDPHSPGQFRANGTMVNQPGFYEAFDVKQGDKMYLPPEKRVILW
ncbi:M13-type metalloendopeptidase [Undibacterium sp. RTI2.1]|uniref:M13 family metallopeptidase n=1 Tax=unclassified Undibacterium TaxID=2630295 RepID=UPI002AB363E7|nr:MULTISPECIES: M13-type metalloendopeptidase [unclassified Undibacterium]MDY7536897.1 M13-type metalloendopeptidase [Undibacterium sp. 5I1]MEB0031673.1 M13-type metalloendopeptidase [Undibacterium sp. RTI2.1]MEB0117944.1 M13-type metalloendopeptidase [Undibacterium sp. RTI2.2]MEB0230402.1 M13-type metalloendopeptidase [Undibacterium sp. 10I3]MEB0258820.1 M13-type metalloendopeptidase [Undibacterium sp. 5I1]